jgi:hypothetical protein
MVIRRFEPVSCAKVAGLLYAIMGFLFGGFLSLISLAAGGFIPNGHAIPAAGRMIFGVGAIVILPILYGCMGFVFALIGAWLYNLVAGMVGGFEIELDKTTV